MPQGLIVAQGLGFNLIAVNPLTGNTFNLVAASEGGFTVTPFFASAGQTVTFISGIAGTADFGTAAVQVSFSGSGGPIPNVVGSTLDLQRFWNGNDTRNVLCDQVRCNTGTKPDLYHSLSDPERARGIPLHLGWIGRS